MVGDFPVTTYERDASATFRKVAESFGGYSNMAGGWPLRVSGIDVRTSEALYQACRFPRHVEIQRLVIEQKSPMSAKMVTKPHRDKTRSDWDHVRVPIMRWCLMIKLVQHWERFGALLRASEDKPIVEDSHKDAFWGAKPVSATTLQGQNVLGRLLEEMRVFANGARLVTVEPLELVDFSLYGEPIAATGTAVTGQLTLQGDV